jgi:hypothetical protein
MYKKKTIYPEAKPHIEKDIFNTERLQPNPESQTSTCKHADA